MIVILGAEDHEMIEIQGIANHLKIKSFHISSPRGGMAHSSDAYLGANKIDDADVWIECCPEWSVLNNKKYYRKSIFSETDKILIDHHEPGDPGYSLPPSQYFEASSIGQFINLLYTTLGTGITLPSSMTEYHMCAASDHCLSAAYQDLCPGVDKNNLLTWRIEKKAKKKNTDKKTIIAQIDKAKKLIESAPDIYNKYGFVIKDIRGAKIPEVQEAACLLGVAILTMRVNMYSLQQMVMLRGSATPEMIRAFANGEIISNINIKFESETRGFAGGIVENN